MNVIAQSKRLRGIAAALARALAPGWDSLEVLNETDAEALDDEIILVQVAQVLESDP